MPAGVLMDLDGTLIDSSPSILAAFEMALRCVGVAPVVPLDSSLIGPPLRATLQRITGRADPALLDELALRFRESYDSTGYRQTRVYPGIADSLRALADGPCELFIVTNKRILPTGRIIDMLGWAQYVTGIYALDSTTPPFANKAELIRYLLQKHGINAADACLVGDTAADAEAALAAAVAFLGVRWGYGDFRDLRHESLTLVDEPAELRTLCALVDRNEGARP
jgi:phosphoglycolate phosphatase